MSEIQIRTVWCLQTKKAFYAFRASVYRFYVHIVANVITRSPADTLRLRAAVALMAVWILLYCYVLQLEPLVRWDARFSHWIQTWRSPAFDQLMLTITMLADLGLCIALLAGMSVWLLAKGRWWLCLYSGCVFFSTTLAVTLIKYLTHRPRPVLTDTTVHYMSFPSAHAARAVIILGLLALIVSWGRSARIKAFSLCLAAASSALVGFSRIYLGVHWLSDVLAGTALAGTMLLFLEWQWHRADDESVNIGLVLSACIIVFVMYCLLNMEDQRLLYGLAHG